MSQESLRITEIFYSLQGESRSSGMPTTFIRLTGCPLRCSYCDSEYAFYGGEKQSLVEILDQVRETEAAYVCVTGGEPLAQPNCISLMALLCDQGLNVSLETSGAMDVVEVDKRVSIVMDLKTPDSKESGRNLYENIPKLDQKDQIKFVICSQSDYQWAKFKCMEYGLMQKVGDVIFSPSYGQVEPADLAQWILTDKLNVRFQTQLHKLLWGDKPGV